jgi:hypothetical protein
MCRPLEEEVGGALGALKQLCLLSELARVLVVGEVARWALWGWVKAVVAPVYVAILYLV